MALSPTSSRGSGGSAAPITRAQYDVALTAVAPATPTKMPFVLNYGTALLNVTNPTNPTPVVSGTYAFAVTVGISDLTNQNVVWSLRVLLDEDDFAAELTYQTETVAVAQTDSAVLTLPFYVPAGSPCYVRVQHLDADTADFNGHVYVQRLS